MKTTQPNTTQEQIKLVLTSYKESVCIYVFTHVCILIYYVV